MSDDVAGPSQRAREVWAAGDYTDIAPLVWEVGERIVERVGVRDGDDVLDVACGTGNAAVQAAAAGGRVVGLDVTPELLEKARSVAAAAGVDAAWVEGDAEELPFDDESYDVVVSTFGCMFAPRHDAAARELVRVLRPGGRMGVCSWTPEGAIGDFFRTVGSHLPPPPEGSIPPVMWGSEEHVRELFEGTGAELDFEREEVVFRFESLPAAVELYTTKFGPIAAAREWLEREGRWAAFERDLTEVLRRHARPDAAGVAYPAEYLVTLGRKRA
ncbi:MAG: methyltransferase domain-containing protein [Thermoleophilaceae bacterium]|nr:methyltransferase domain-containing protein [Thermoleophilaceae bacterium]